MESLLPKGELSNRPTERAQKQSTHEVQPRGRRLGDGTLRQRQGRGPEHAGYWELCFTHVRVHSVSEIWDWSHILKGSVS